jgi:hypothetical protein
LKTNICSGRIGEVYLAGLPVRDELVLALALLVDDPNLASRLEDAYGRCVRVLALTVLERETIIRALDDAPAGLEQLRSALLHTARKRDGLASSSSTRIPDAHAACSA